jgi:REP element-mobilizing transposase RayT
VARLVVHLVWATRERRPWLVPEVDMRLERLLSGSCDSLGCRLLACGNASDHVHVLVTYAPTMTVAGLAHRLKGESSRALALRLPPGFQWQVGYFAESVAEVAGVVDYVRGQRQHHERHDGGAPEAWERR